QPVGQRLQCVAAAGGEPQMAAFLGKGFGGGRANALGGTGDQDALAAQVQIHGFFSLAGWVSEEGRRKWIGGMRPRSTLHCSVAPRRRLVHCRASSIGGAIVPASHKEVLD